MSGEALRKRREESGQDLKEIAHLLKIRYDYLKAIENETFEKLPVAVYAKGYIRDYAKFLNVDPELIITAYIQKTSPPVIEKSQPDVKAEKEKKSRNKYVAVFIGLLVIAAASILLLLNPAPEKTVTHPQNVTAKKMPPIQTVQTVRPAQQIQPVRPAQPLQQLQPVQPATQTVKQAQPVQPIKKEEKIAERSEPFKGRVLDIYATDTTWLLVNIDGAESKDMLLKQGESVKLTAKQEFSLKVGNAGGIRLVFDGKEIGAPGEPGQVMNFTLPPKEIPIPNP